MSSKVRWLEVDENAVQQRLDNFLSRVLNNTPKSHLYRLIRKGEVRVNRKRVKPEVRLCQGDLVRIPPVYQGDKQKPVIHPGQQLDACLKHRVVYEDEAIIVVDKPSGLAVHGGSGVRLGLIEALRAQRPDCRYLELVHRLDRDTSGVVVIAKKRKYLVDLQQEFRIKKVRKTYWCLVQGSWGESRIKVDAPLLRHDEQSSGERRVSVQKQGKAAVTHFSLIKQFDGYAWIEAKPVTGRTHQIRVHCQYIGHSILGDDKYQTQKGKLIAENLKLNRLFLHAAQLRIKHPISLEVMTFNAELDSRLQRLLIN